MLVGLVSWGEASSVFHGHGGVASGGEAFSVFLGNMLWWQFYCELSVNGPKSRQSGPINRQSGPIIR